MVPLHLSSEVETKLRYLAARNGQGVEDYLRELVEREVRAVTGAEAPPLAHGVEKSPPLTPELRKWLLEQFNEEEAVASLREMREKGGLELADFLPELEELVARDEPTEP